MNLLDYEKYYHLESEFIIPRDEFEKIIEENQRLNNDIKVLLKENEAKEKVIIKYDNVLNEFEKWLIENIEKSDLKGCSFEQTYITGKWNSYKKSLNKLNKLKESDK